MKNRYTTIDLLCAVAELRENIGLRVLNVYDIDSKTYLIKLNRPEQKAIIMFESGYRIHSTQFEWPKSMFPSNFAMKMRKHLKGRRLEKINLLGIDRVVDMQFGSDEAAYHVIVELYDRGNIALTDHEYVILNILRQRTDEDKDVKLVVREKYPIEGAKQHAGLIPQTRVEEILRSGKDGDMVKKLLNPHVEYGSALIMHSLLSVGLKDSAKLGFSFNIDQDIEKLMEALQIAEQVLVDSMKGNCKGYILQKSEKKIIVKENESSEILQYTDFFPHLYKQFEGSDLKLLKSFNEAVDEFFSSIGSQKLDMKIIQQEKTAMKKINNVKKDHEKRIAILQKNQVSDREKALLIQDNEIIINQAIGMINQCVYHKKQWKFIENALIEARNASEQNVAAQRIVKLKLMTNHISMALKPTDYETGEEQEDIDFINVDVDLALSAQGNSRAYFDKKRFNATKEVKTNDSTQKALKNAEKKMKITMKEVTTAVSINKARKIYWFEKFLWFISSENHIVIAGRDQQQNELIVKKYLRPGDIYVHADLHGASSVVIKNPSGNEVSPITLQEAGSMAICNSGAWDARIITSAWWVRHNQVSKTAPTGEYLTTGSFMIRGKKNFLPPSYLVYGFGCLFKIDESTIGLHKDERKTRTGGMFEGKYEKPDPTLPPVNPTVDDDEASGDNADVSSSVPDTSEQDLSDNDTLQDSPTSSVQEAAEDDAEEDHSQPLSDDDNDDEEEEEEESNEMAVNDSPVDGAGSDFQSLLSSSSAGEDTSASAVSTPNGVNDDGEAATKEVESTAAPSVDEEVKDENTSSSKPASNDVTSKVKIEFPETNINITRTKINKDKQPTVKIIEQPPKVENKNNNEKQYKRGQKAKLKKIKQKYADQDEDEKILRMKLLCSAGEAKPTKKGKKLQDKEEKYAAATARRIKREEQIKTNAAKPQKPAKEEEFDEEEIPLDNQMLASLTGIPYNEDELIFCIPMCAPYSVFTNYKYKVKMTPGNNKRGKASTSCISLFGLDKNATQREKEMFKSLKGVDMSRNIPGKVKISAPNRQRVNKKK